MSEEYSGNEFANGNNGRFEGLAESYKAGGRTRELPDSVKDAVRAVLEFARGNTELAQDLNTSELVTEMAAVRKAKDAADEVAKELGRRWDYMRLQLMPERFEAEGLQNLTVKGVGRVGLRGDIYASIQPGQKDAAFDWLDENGRGDLVQKQVNSSSLKASLKRMLESGEDIPEEFFKVTPYTMATLTKA